jgi:hypothetical protein
LIFCSTHLEAKQQKMNIQLPLGITPKSAVMDQVIFSGSSTEKTSPITSGARVFGHKIFFSDTSIWLVSIAIFAQALSTLDSPSAQAAHPLAQAAQVLLSHVFLPFLQANQRS